MQALKLILAVGTVCWMIFISWQTYLTRVYVYNACSYAEKTIDIAGKPKGFDHDVDFGCR